MKQSRNPGRLRLYATTLVCTSAAALACSSSSTSASSGVDAGQPDAGAAADAGADAHAAPPGMPGSGAVSGAIGGASYGAVASAFWAGAPDDPATTVIYVFSAPVACSELASPGWDTRIADATKVLEMKAFGTTPNVYSVVTTLTPAPGEASVNYTLSSRSGTPKEDGSTKGTVTLTKLTPSISAEGSFSLTFVSGTVMGTFDAVFCPGAHEP